VWHKCMLNKCLDCVSSFSRHAYPAPDMSLRVSLSVRDGTQYEQPDFICIRCIFYFEKYIVRNMNSPISVVYTIVHSCSERLPTFVHFFLTVFLFLIISEQLM